MLKRILNFKRITVRSFATYLGISGPTAHSYLSDPTRIRTPHRIKLSNWKKLGLPIETIDQLCNGTLDEKDITILVKGQPINQAVKQ